MIATVRLDEKLEHRLNSIANMLHKKKSQIIREAIEQYAISIEKAKKSKLQMAIEKTKEIDKKEFSDFEGTIDDGM
ncbi:MAG: CopG family transcriptional regulator [Sulfurimonas sp. RIFOXYC2_FULL_36_7]|nr:MAG: CopG family transcriptional regulator [Sulfurimonas sp. RIFOXYC2_FULL_36_7]